MSESKTKKCNYCNKRRKVEDMYNLSYIATGNVIINWICNQCNLKLDYV